MIGKFNPLNIRNSSGFSWNGQSGSTRGFADFVSTEMCRRAGLYLLRRSYRRAGCFTIEKILYRWAPQSENDTENYIKFVCGLTGFKRNDHMVFDSDFAALLAAMEIMEQGIGTMFRKRYFEGAKEAYLGIIDKFNIRNDAFKG